MPGLIGFRNKVADGCAVRRCPLRPTSLLSSLLYIHVVGSSPTPAATPAAAAANLCQPWRALCGVARAAPGRKRAHLMMPPWQHMRLRSSKIWTGGRQPGPCSTALHLLAR